MAAFVLGNGISRNSIDIDQLLTKGAVYGCNALYRTHTPTALIATDKPISTTIQESGYSSQNRFYTRNPIPGLGASEVPTPYRGFSSGPIAASIAAMDGNRHIYLLGFDMGPALNGRFNNMYAGTEFYKAVDAVPTFTGNWIKQLIIIMTDYRTVKFTRVYGPTTAEIPEFGSLPNFEKLSLEQFSALINTRPKDL